MPHRLLRGLLPACLAAPAAAATLSFAPSTPAVRLGDAFMLDVVVADAADLYGFQFDVVFAAPLVQATGVEDGGFLAAAGGPADFLPGSIDNMAGTVSFTAGTLLGPGPGATGTGVLARLSFQAVSAGTFAVRFANVALLDAALAELGTSALAGSIDVSPVPEPGPAALLAAGLAALAWRARRHAGGGAAR